jgi:NitT/TauT family transport system substrate-binding protein
MKFSPGWPSPVRGGRTNRRNIAAVTVAAVAMALLAAGCQAHTTASEGAGISGSSQLTVAATPGVADAPLYLAARDGLFARAGLRVTIESSNSASSELHALTAGTIDVASSDYADFFSVEGNDSDLLIVADGYDAAPNVMEVLTLPGSGITTPQDLVGKTIGTPEPQEFPFNASTPYSLDTMATQSVLLNDGVEPTQVSWKPMPSQDLVGALKSGQVNAIVVTEPYIFQAESQLGATEVLDSLSGATANLPLSGYFTRSSFARKNADPLRIFRSVLLQAEAEAAAGNDVRSVLADSSQMNTQTAAMVTLGLYPTSLNVNGVQQVADLMYDFGMLAQALNVSSMIFH